eukprot:TRINITY_DN42658_c0_g1_i1.p1 TRINITY_DN42658_c0_g1~~TRINITY_DN42658_c0_g1_i1.p1  ORF type:complete len:637 (-),score=120.24 TRINITY_DN42658_c0_g1_i1:61-1971(-)
MTQPFRCNVFWTVLTSVAVCLPAQGFLCSITADGNINRLPRAWRNGLKNIHELLACPEEQSSLRPESSDDYLRGLEYPTTFFKATLKKSEQGEKVGFEISRKTDYFEVGKVQPSGPLARWNDANPAKALMPGDRVIQVNRVAGNSTRMVEEMRRSVNVSLSVIRLHKEDLHVVDRQKTEKQLNKVLRISAPPGLGRGMPEPANSKVVVLHARNVDEFLGKSPFTVLMVFANWCGHCQELAPVYTKSADLVADLGLQQSVKFAKYDMGDEANRENNIGDTSRYNITSFPAFFVVQAGKHEPFHGLHSAEEIAAYVGAKARGEDPEGPIKEVLFKMRPMLYRSDVSAEKILDLEPESFDETVLTESPTNNRVWIIEYYSDKCPFCRSLKPEYIKASDEIKKQLGEHVRFGALNSRAFPDLAERFGVTSYPWIISVYAGSKGEDMAGLGGAETIIEWAKLQHKKLWKKEPKWAKELPKWPEPSAPNPGAQMQQGVELVHNKSGTWRELLGQRTWFFLHTLAAKYPEEPTEADQAAVRGVVAALGQLYPCPICRQHLQEKLQAPELGPVPTDKRTDLTRWFCQLHNMVNKDLGKAQHNCNAFELDLKYLKSCGECTVSKAVDTATEAVPSTLFARSIYRC